MGKVYLIVQRKSKTTPLVSRTQSDYTRQGSALANLIVLSKTKQQSTLKYKNQKTENERVQ